jgi:hypothetical protein
MTPKPANRSPFRSSDSAGRQNPSLEPKVAVVTAACDNQAVDVAGWDTTRDSVNPRKRVIAACEARTRG